MAISPPVRVLLAAFALAATSFGQTTSDQKPANPPCASPSQTSGKPAADKPCPPAPDTKKPSPAEEFPFPGEPAKPSAPSNGTPDAPSPNAAHPSDPDDHPFPTKAPPLPGADSSSGSSSSGSSSSADPNAPPDSAAADDAPDTRSTRKKLPKVRKLQSDEDRAAEDLDIAKFYEGKGNLNAAYLRVKDAVKSQPNDPETHFALAEIAQKLKKRDEAIAEFNAYLKLDPDGLKIDAARKAISQLQ
ncbi:MAG: Tetratricopeptide 2 repeat-containing protein [Edaphobacter sp.]|nr:Tetratricopeptide 2 repeat-containing protein [Edaphobacter sp.]